MHEATAALLRFFTYKHLPEHLQTVSKRFYDLAHLLAGDSRLDGPELTVCLRKLLEAKDCAVRAAVPSPIEDRAKDASVPTPRSTPIMCSRCSGSGAVPDWTVCDASREEPDLKTCPACQGEGIFR